MLKNKRKQTYILFGVVCFAALSLATVGFSTWVVGTIEDSDEVKWYDNEEEMRKLSKKFPDVLFKLHGEGEDNEDIWDKYFMNGKMQYCPAKIMCPPFDRAKLN